MMIKRSITAVLAAFTLAACSDSNAPDPIQLTEAQAEDMMDALDAIGSFDGGTGAFRATAGYGKSATSAITIAFDESEPCPGGGTHGTKGNMTVNDAGTQATANFTQTYSNCKATSSSGTVWTFNGAPSIVFTFTSSFNQTSGVYTMSGTQKGALDVSSSVGSGRCVIDLTMTGSGNETSFTSSVSGTVCGRTVSITVTE